MSYDPTKDDYEYNPELTADENRANMVARYEHLYQWAKDNWGYSCHAAGAEARAQYLEMCVCNDDDNLDVDEDYGWEVVKEWLDEYAMVEILDQMVEDGSIYPPEERRGYGNNGYGWMLDAVGYDIPGCMDYLKEWLDNNDYYQLDELKKVLAKDWHDMWEDDEEA